MRSGRRKRQLEIERREEGFDNRIRAGEHRKPYDALQDDHSSYYFILPSVQDHLKRLRKAFRREMSSEAGELARSIERKIEEVGKFPKHRSRRKPTKQQLYAMNFMEGERLHPQTELLRSGSRRNELSPSHNDVVKNLTESKLPPLSKRVELEGNATTQTSSQQARAVGAVRQTQSPRNLTPTSVLKHEHFQRFLDEKKQQVQASSTERPA